MMSPGLLGAVLVAVVAGLRTVQARRPGWFRVLPVPFWCYFLPMGLSSLGLLPASSPLYGFLGRYALPLCLSLLLVNVDLRSLARLGRPALGAMAVGSLGIGVGAAVFSAVGARWLPPEAWKALGALSASWTGGSANMLAVKEALAVPETVFAPLVVVDPFFAYAWMAGLIFFAGHQARFDRWTRAQDVGVPKDDRTPAAAPWPWPAVPAAAFLLAGASIWGGDRFGPWASRAVAEVAPGVAKTLTATTWTVLLVTTASLGVSFSRRLGARPERTETVGTFVLYVLLASLGARASLQSLGHAPVFLAVGAALLGTHILFLAVGARLFRWPLFLVASASQACVGGVVSAPMVSAVYRPALSVVGLLLAVLGNVLGTYFGLATAQVCWWLGGGQ